MSGKKKAKFSRRYSGPKSKAFWARVNALPHSDQRVAYALGCCLQDLEGRVLTWIESLIL